MQVLMRPFGGLHVQVDGPDTGPTVVFANSLGTDLRLWAKVLPLLPAGLRTIRYDKRGHGLSQGEGHRIEDHRDDAIAVIEAFATGPVAFVGLSIGGLIAQAVASHRPDLIRALVLSNTGAKLGTAESWQARIAAVEAGGVASIADAVMERWFAAPFRATAELALWRQMLANTPNAGYIAACRALAGADLRASTNEITCPTLVVGGAEDGASAPEVVRAMAALITGATSHIIPGAGHLPCVENPQAWADLVAPFLKAQCHV
jgi:3-oxoadipate enol-lactonase